MPSQTSGARANNENVGVRLEQRQHQASPRKVRAKLKPFSIRLGLDMPFLFLVIALLFIGLVMMFSASYPAAYAYQSGNSYYYLTRQAIFAAIGIGLMFILSYFDYHHLHKFAFLILILSFLLLTVVLFIPSSTGVHRWLPLGIFTMQASEISKFAIIIFFAHWGSVHINEMGTFKIGVLPEVIILAITVVLMALEPHWSGIVIIISLAAVMMFVSGVKLRWFVLAGGLIVAAILVLYLTDNLGYAMDRIGAWGQALDYIDQQTWDDTYQTRNSLYAIGSGGFWGLGLGQSRQKHLYLPEAQNDFIFAVVCEEMGFIGALIILLVFALLVWRGITISMRAKDKFGSLLGIGLTAQIGIQVVINIMVVTDLLPNTGISLPFFSYGGSSLIMLLAQMGIVLSISRTANIEKT